MRYIFWTVNVFDVIFASRGNGVSFSTLTDGENYSELIYSVSRQRKIHNQFYAEPWQSGCEFKGFGLIKRF